MSKIMALVLALVMCMAMSATASAASIKIKHADGYTPDTNTEPETYLTYKILDAVVPTNHELTDTNIESSKTTDETGFTYTIKSNSKWYTAVNTSGFFDLVEIDDTDDVKTYNVTLKKTLTADASQAKTMATYFANYAKNNNIAQDYSLTLDTAQSLDDGYYLIVSSLGSNLVLATTDVEITEKNSYPSIDKKQDDKDPASGGEYDDTKVNVQVGDTIYYEVVVYVPATANQNIIVTDTMSEGLTPAAANTIVAKVGAPKETDGSAPDNFTTAATGVTAEAGTAPATYKITITPNDDNKGKYIELTFTATVNDKAIVLTGTEARKNDVVLDYSNFQQKDSVEFTTYATGAHKYDGANNDDLAGAEFKLQVQYGKTGTFADLDVVLDGGFYRVEESTDAAAATITTPTDGKIVIRGLDNENAYQLVETKAPTGYNDLAAPAALVLVEDTGAETLSLAAANITEIANLKGTELPSTGGIGTTIFYIIGAILVVGAGVLLVTRRRMNVQ